MCGLFNQLANQAEVAGLFDGLDPASIPELTPRYNIAPTQPILTAGRNAAGKIGVGFMKWGLVPSWAADDRGGAKLINARADGVAEKPSFRTAFRKRRCVIFATGFYEWLAVGKRKQPYHFRRPDGKPFLFAGLWEQWQGGEAPLLTACLITTDADGTVTPVHNRMPVILDAAAVDAWLNPAAAIDQLQALLKPAPDDLLEAVTVSRLVNSPKNDGPECIDPAAPE